MDQKSTAGRTVRIGEIAGVHGVKGWVKIYSETAPKENIFEYSPWQVVTVDRQQTCRVQEWQYNGKGLIAQLEGIEDRDQAVALIGSTIEVSVDLFEPLSEGDYYWFQLQGMQVISLYEGGRYPLGTVEKIMETGANDVLVVRSDSREIKSGSGEQNREHLIPWTPGLHILKVDLESGEIEVDWDPEF